MRGESKFLFVGLVFVIPRQYQCHCTPVSFSSFCSSACMQRLFILIAAAAPRNRREIAAIAVKHICVMDTALGHDYAMIFSLLLNDNAHLRTFTHDYACYAPKHLTLPHCLARSRRKESRAKSLLHVLRSFIAITQFYSNYAVICIWRRFKRNNSLAYYACNLRLPQIQSQILLIRLQLTRTTLSQIMLLKGK